MVYAAQELATSGKSLSAAELKQFSSASKPFIGSSSTGLAPKATPAVESVKLNTATPRWASPTGAPSLFGAFSANATAIDPLAALHDEHMTQSTTQLINSIIHRDRLGPDYSDYLTGQFSRDYIYGEDPNSVLQLNKLSLIPEILLEQVRLNAKDGGLCFMGLFPDISRAWLALGSSLYLWSFENSRDFTCFNKLDSDIIDVALVRARSAVFIDEVEYLLVVVTASEICLLGVSFASNHDTGTAGAGAKPYSWMDLILHETDLRYSSDEVNMISVCGTESGRIFLSGSDGHLYELLYRAEKDWFSHRCRKVNRTASTLGYLLPTFLKVVSSRPKIVRLVADASRNLLYGLTESSAVQSFWLGSKGQDFEFIGSTDHVVDEAIRFLPVDLAISRKSLELIDIFPIHTEESNTLCLVGVCRSGIRLYFSSRSATFSGLHNALDRPLGPAATTASGPPQSLRLVHVRAAFEENRIRDPKKLVHRWSPNLHRCIYSNGVFVAANSLTPEQDNLVAMVVNPAIASLSSPDRRPLEYAWEASIQGKVWAIDELGPHRADATNLGVHKELTLAHLKPRRMFAALTNVGVYVFSKLRPVDRLRLILAKDEPDLELLKGFFDEFGKEQAAALCVALCCGADGPAAADLGDNVYNNGIAALLKLGGEPKSDDISKRLLAGPASGFGQLIATQLEFENSPLHDGLYFCFARLVAGIWKTNVWDFKALEPSVRGNLHRFSKFMNDNAALFTERRLSSGASGQMNDGTDASKRRRLALEKESVSILQLRSLINRLLELLAFLSICSEYRLFETGKKSQFYQEHSAADIELLLTTDQGRRLVTELGNFLVQHQLKSKVPVKGLCETLRVKCPNFFSEQDVLLQEGIEALARAKACHSWNDRISSLHAGLNCLMKACSIIPVAKFSELIGQLDQAGFQEGSIRFGLCYAAALDPGDLALEHAKNPHMRLDTDQHEVIRQRETIYTWLLNSVASTGFDPDRSAKVIELNPGIDIDSIRAKCLALVTSCHDELFHFRFYDWLVASQFSSTLLDLPPNECLARYLRMTFLSRLDSHRDLLWKWLAKGRRYNDAASVMLTIASSREYELSLAQRIEYLSLAVAHCKSSTSNDQKTLYPALDSSEIAPVELSSLEDQLEVANLQLEIVNDASTCRSVPDSVLDELDGGAGLLSVTELFNQYARPYGLTESCLKIIHCSGLSNDRLVSGLWHDLFVSHLGPNLDSCDDTAFSVFGRKLEQLGRRLYPSPQAFPLSHIVDVTGRSAARAGIDSGWLVTVLLNAGVPHSVVYDELEGLWASSSSRLWHSNEGKVFLASGLAFLAARWLSDSTAKNQILGNRRVIALLKSLHVTANELGAFEVCDMILEVLRGLQA